MRPIPAAVNAWHDLILDMQDVRIEEPECPDIFFRPEVDIVVQDGSHVTGDEHTLAGDESFHDYAGVAFAWNLFPMGWQTFSTVSSCSGVNLTSL